MACKTETKVIGDHTYAVTQWGATEALLMKWKLIKAFGPALAEVAGTLFSNDEEIEDMSSVSRGFEKLFSLNDPIDIVAIIKECVTGVSCDGNFISESSFEELYSGDELLEAYQVAVFVIKTNYSSLMKGKSVGNLLKKIKADK